MGREGAVGEFVGAALRWWRGVGVPVRGGVGNYILQDRITETTRHRPRKLFGGKCVAFEYMYLGIPSEISFHVRSRYHCDIDTTNPIRRFCR